MKYIINIIFTFAIFAIANSGCKKGNSGSSTCSSTSGGTGGSAILNVTAEHANSFIDSCTFYIKYGTCDAPANGIYDDSAVCKAFIPGDTAAMALFRNLTTGNYYLYGVGYHKGYTPPFVKGGSPCTIFHSNDSLNIVVPTYSYNN